MELQVTLYSTTGKYKPISTIIDIASVDYYKSHKKECQQRAIMKMCAQHHLSTWALARDGYTKIKVREYDLAKITAEKAERYEQIKKERGWA